MGEEIKHELNTCGLCCPQPMIATIKLLARLNSGEKIKVLSTDHGFLTDVNALVRAKKIRIIETGEADDYDYALIEKI